MIELNTDKGIVEIESWEDVLTRPGFKEKINPQQSKLKAVIGQYSFEEEIHCGLPCNQPHKHGYLVVTQDGHETNIGNICGKRYFGIDFEQMRNTFERDVARKKNQEKIIKFKNQIREIEAEIEHLENEGATWVYKECRKLVSPSEELPLKIVTFFRDLVRTGSNDIVLQRAANESEQELLNKQIIEEKIGRLRGVDCLKPNNDLHILVGQKLKKRLNDIKSINVNGTSDRELKQAAKWIGEFDLYLEQAKSAVRAGKSLLTQENLRQLQALLTESDEREKFSKYLQHLPIAA